MSPNWCWRLNFSRMNRRGTLSRTEQVLRPAVLFFRGLIDFVYPPLCLLCDERLAEDETFLCSGCRETLSAVEGPICNGEDYSRKLMGKVYFARSVAFFHYTPAMQKLIHGFKYRNLPRLVDFFAEEISRRMFNMPGCLEFDLMVPVPLHGTRRRERGYNQAELLARRLSEKTGIPLLHDGLIRTRYTSQQAKLDGRQRSENVKNAFRVKNPQNVHRRKTAVVDDVLTTGNTLNECARVLLEAGAEQVTALTIVRI